MKRIRALCATINNQDGKNAYGNSLPMRKKSDACGLPAGAAVFPRRLAGRNPLLSARRRCRRHSAPLIMFEGTFTALVTPFRDDRFDEDAFVRLIEGQIAA